MLAHLITEVRSEDTGDLAWRRVRRRHSSRRGDCMRAFGFSYCQAFGEYQTDPNSVFMTLQL